MGGRNAKAWLYLLPAVLFLGFFMVYPLFDVFVYSFEEGYNSASQTYFGTGLYNYSYVLHDPYFLQAVKNTFILVIITVPVSTGIALLISLALSSIRKAKPRFGFRIEQMDLCRLQIKPHLASIGNDGVFRRDDRANGIAERFAVL